MIDLVAVRTWHEIDRDFSILIDQPYTEETEEELWRIIHYRERLNLVPNCECPHSLSPEDMLKSLSIQMIAKFGSQESVSELRKLNNEDWASLNCIIKVSLQLRDELDLANSRIHCQCGRKAKISFQVYGYLVECSCGASKQLWNRELNKIYDDWWHDET